MSDRYGIYDSNSNVVVPYSSREEAEIQLEYQDSMLRGMASRYAGYTDWTSGLVLVVIKE